MVSSEQFVASIKRQVGWFLMIGVGSLLVVLLIAGIRSDLFSKRFVVYVKPPSAASFYEGQPVKFQGFGIGHINEIELQQQGEVRMTLYLLEQYRQMLHRGAAIRLSKEGLFGEQVVEITAGDVKAPAIKEGDTLAYETEASLDQLLLDLKPAVTNANLLLHELAQLAKWMNDPEGDVRQAMSGFRELTEGVERGQLKTAIAEFSNVLVHLQELAKRMEQGQVVERLSHSLAATSKILDDLRPLSETLGKQGADTIEQINKLLKQVDQLSKALTIVASDLSELTPELPGLARETRATVEEMRGLLQGLRGSWLFGSSKQNGGIKSDEDISAPPAVDMRP